MKHFNMILLTLTMVIWLSSFELNDLMADETIQVVTSEFPPYNYLENGSPKGFCTEIVQALLEETGYQAPISTLPWARAYEIALKQENILIYIIARTPERETDFHWIGQFGSGHFCLFCLKENPIHLSGLNDTRAYLIGTTRSGSRIRFLQNQGMTNLEPATHSRMNAVKLINKRITFWAEDELAATYTVRQMGLDPEKTIRKALKLELKLNGYLAFSKRTPLKLVEKFSLALTRIKTSGLYDQIENKYLLLYSVQK